MRALRVILAAVILCGCVFVGPAGAADDPDVPGELEEDQSPPIYDLSTPEVPASPVAISPLGPVAPELYTTDLIEPEEVMAETGLKAITSTASGTSALTGAVIGASTGEPIVGAVVTLERSAGGASALSTTTDSNGTFAFINIPATGFNGLYDLKIVAPGFGRYEILNDPYDPDETYIISAELDVIDQVWDESGTTAPNADQLFGTGSLRYDAQKRVPPTIMVEMYPRNEDNCAASSSTSRGVRRYPWEFYILHVATAEIYDWPEKVVKANMIWQHNYAWYRKQHHLSNLASNADVTNTTQTQCFRPHEKYRPRWVRWLNQIVDQRVGVGIDNDIQETNYRDGNYPPQCREDGYPADGNLGSQFGSLARAQECGATSFSTITQYYFTGEVMGQQAPPAPQTSFDRFNGGVEFRYNSVVGDSKVGWRYGLEKHVCIGGGCGWGTIATTDWSWRQREVVNSHRHTTGTCNRYRVKATNPAGTSSYSRFNGGNQICPG